MSSKKEAKVVVVTGATSPELVTHAFSLSDTQLAWLILNNKKNIENRSFRLSPGWYAVATTATAYTDVHDEVARSKKYAEIVSPLHIAKGVVLGVCKIGYAKPSGECLKEEWCVPSYKVCNFITATISFCDWSKGIKCRGNFGAWPLKESQEAVRAAVKNSWEYKHGQGIGTKAAERADDQAASAKEDGGQKRKAEKEAGAQAAVSTLKAAKPSPSAVAERAQAQVKGGGDIRGFFGKK